MIVGILPEEAKIIADILSAYKSEYDFFAYGSRVKGTYGAVSDLDILIKGEHAVKPEQMQELKYRFDESLLPYIVNFTDYHQAEPSFYERIKPDLIKL